MRRLAALTALVLVLAGCGSKDQLLPIPPGPGQSDIQVDTPALRALKAATHIATCVPGTAPGGKLPHLTLPCLGGGPSVALDTLRGPMVINVWNTGCDICAKETPAIESFFRAHGTTVPVVGIDVADTEPDLAITLSGKRGVTYPMLADPGEDIAANSPLPALRGLPVTFFIDAQGGLAGLHFGAVTSDDLVKLSNQYLGTTL